MDRPPPPSMPRLLATPEDGRRAPIMAGHLSGLVFAHGSLELRWYVPDAVDEQVPHDRDEIYFIVSGTGVFVRAEESMPFADNGAIPIAGEERVTFQPGDTLFVPAGTAHFFEATSPDFGAWMIFYGPEGGEGP